MTQPITTTLHRYSFDIRTPQGAADWMAFREARKTEGAPLFGPVFGNGFHSVADLDGSEITLDAKWLHRDQWNTVPGCGSEKGRRVFDWELEANHSNAGAPEGIRRGHYLTQTPEMKELRRNTCACGYCGKQEPAAKGYVFCPHCIGSEYMDEATLHLTRMRPVDQDGERAPLKKAEHAHLMPIFLDAQIHGSTERDGANIIDKRREVADKYEKTVANATTERDGLVWLMDHGVRLNNVLFYGHTGRFGFGWRKKLSVPERDALLSIISEFSWPYDLECDDGRKLSGN